jgi:signal transduction histidine kinase
MAHEINNPLGSILSHVDYLKAVEKEDGKRESLGWIESETNRIAALVRRIRAYSAPGDRGDSRAELNRAARETAEVLRFTLEKRHLALTLDLDDSLPPVVCPSDELRQVALNLLLNAYEACAEGGTIRVSTARRPDGTAVLGISDNGAGIDPSDMKNIFDPFFTTKQSRLGSGLGLSICYTIVKRAGGDIRVSSAPGKGTDVEVILRVHERPDRG